MSKKSFEIGYKVAVQEILEGKSSNISALDRRIFLDSIVDRQDWDRGYKCAVTAYRLGHNIRLFVESRCYVVTTATIENLVTNLLDNTWPFELKPDPRRKIIK